jgi:hypothetical protein
MCDFKEDPCFGLWAQQFMKPLGKVTTMTPEKKWDAAKEVVQALIEHYKNLANRLELHGDPSSNEARTVQSNFEKLLDWFLAMDGVPIEERNTYFIG